MEKEFIPYEQALALKELGFNEPCFGWFGSTLIPSNFTEFFLETEFGMNESPSDWVNSNFLDKACSAPLYQQAFRWFREKYNLYASFNIYNDKWLCVIKSTISNETEISGYIVATINNGHPTFDTYPEAEFECLKKLIEIIENQK